MINIARLIRSALFVSLAATFTTIGFAQNRQSSLNATARSPQAQVPSKATTGVSAARGTTAQSVAGKSLTRVTTDAMRVLSSSAQGVLLEFAADSFNTSSTAAGVAVSASGFERLAQPGQPDLPSRVVFVGVPQTGGVRLSFSTEGTETSAGVQVRPAVGFGGSNQQTEHSILAGGGFWPAAPAEILSIETLRGVRFARVRVSPAQYDAATKTLRLHHNVQVSLSFDRPAVQTDRPDVLDSVIEPMFVNGADAIHWKLDLTLQDSINFFERSNVWCRVKTESTGIYRITPDDLKKAGFDPATIPPATMKLYSIGPHAINGPYPDTMVEVPVYVKDNGDSKFDKGEYLAFYAESPSYWGNDSLWRTNDTLWRTNVFTDYNCWWLTWGGGNGRRMDTVSGAGATNPQPDAYEHVRLEQDSLCPARGGLLWLWKDIVKTAGLDTTAAVGIELPQRDTIRWIKGRFYGRNDNSAQYRVRLYLNETLLDSLSIAAGPSIQPAANFTLDSIPPEAGARPGKTDTLWVELYGDQGMEVYLDFLEVGYSEKLAVTKAEPQLEFVAVQGNGAEFGVDGATGDVLLLDVTNPYGPVRITGTDVSGSRRNLRLAASGLRRLRGALSSGLLTPKEVVRRSPGNLRSARNANYYIVCPDEFYHAAELYARYREGNVAGIPNAHVGIAKLSEVYDDYAFGIEEPGAIKRLLQAKRPAYVLLAGDGTYDYRNILQLRTGPVLPPYEVGYDIDPEVYGPIAMALDAWYADWDGGGSSPDLILGRVTVRSPVEFRQFLDRVKRYETQPLGYWAKRYLLLGDDEIEGSYDRPDGLGIFHIPFCEEQADSAAGLLDPVKVYLTEYPLTSENLKAEASAEFIRQLNSGAVLFCFFGHGAGFQLCHEQILHITNTVPLVNNGTRSPMAFYGSCGVGRFEDTRYEAIAEELVRRDGGTIAGVGATKATDATTNEGLAVLMFSRLMNYPDDPIGPAFFQAYVAKNTLYHLFGDPATVLRMPHRGPVPDVRPDTFYPGGRNEFEATDTANTKGLYEISAHEAIWHREYHSTYTGGGTFSITYDLPGYEIHHAAGTFDTSRIHGSFIVPRMQYPETTDVANGRYIRVPSTGRVSLFSFGGSTPLSYERDSIPLDTAVVPTTDNEPPLVSLYADRIPLVPGDTNNVPRGFNLVGRLRDTSGIFLVPNMDPSTQGVALSLKMSGTTTPLASYFHYDNNSTVSGQFTYPLELQNELDSLSVTASDNMVDPTNPGQNRARVTVLLRTQLTDALTFANCLVYPNPITDNRGAKFTFSLNRAALVSVKIFTIAGRLVRVLPATPCGFDYNQLEWDGLDKDGQPLANGVYLYKLDARVTESSSAVTQSASTSFRDKFIIHR